MTTATHTRLPAAARSRKSALSAMNPNCLINFLALYYTSEEAGDILYELIMGR